MLVMINEFVLSFIRCHNTSQISVPMTLIAYVVNFMPLKLINGSTDHNILQIIYFFETLNLEIYFFIFSRLNIPEGIFRIQKYIYEYPIQKI